MHNGCQVCTINTLEYGMKFRSYEDKLINGYYHLDGACLHLAKELLKSIGNSPVICDKKDIRVISMEKVGKWPSIEGEKCQFIVNEYSEHEKKLAQKLQDCFLNREGDQEVGVLHKHEWIHLRNEYWKEAGLSHRYVLSLMYDGWKKVGTPGRVVCIGVGILGVCWVQQSVYNFFNPKKGHRKPIIRAPFS